MGIIWVNDEPYDFSLSESYLFASFIVAVDPVAVSVGIRQCPLLWMLWITS